MPPLNFHTKRLSLHVDLPQPVVSTLRRVKGARERNGASRPPSERLIVPDAAPQVTPEERDPSQALPFFEAIHDQVKAVAADGGIEELLPHGWAEADLSRAVASTWWYHTIELPHGIVTPGAYDHRPLLEYYDLPADLRGTKVLDVATFDGFWAFEFERRGAEVVATDVPRIRDIDVPVAVGDLLAAKGIDWPTGTAFRIAHRALSSRVSRIERNVYDLDPRDVGTFDLVHVSDLLLHLRDPMAALIAVAKVTGDRAIITDCFDPAVPAGFSRYAGGWSVATWWLPSLETLVQMVSDAGFSDVRVRRTFRLSTGDAPLGPWRVSLLATK